jgi:hypothetical protein
MKYTKKFTVEIKMKEFRKFAISLVDNKKLHEAIKHELYQSWNGIIYGEWGGAATDWTYWFYYNLYNDGIIEQTQHSIDIYGKFEKIKEYE